jgi:hypothetical protein
MEKEKAREGRKEGKKVMESEQGCVCLSFGRVYSQ